MTCFLNQGGVVISSQTMQAQLSNIHALAHILGTCTLILSSCTIFTDPQKHHVTASHPSKGDKPSEHEWVLQKNTGTERKWSIIYICIRSLHFL